MQTISYSNDFLHLLEIVGDTTFDNLKRRQKAVLLDCAAFAISQGMKLDESISELVLGQDDLPDELRESDVHLRDSENPKDDSELLELCSLLIESLKAETK